MYRHLQGSRRHSDSADKKERQQDRRPDREEPGIQKRFQNNWTKLSPIWRPSTDEALRVLDQHEGRPRRVSLQPHSLFHQNQVPHLHLLLRTKWWKMCENSNITRIMFLGSLIFFSRKVNFLTCALLLLSVSANLKCFQLHFAEADNLQVDNKVQDSRGTCYFLASYFLQGDQSFSGCICPCIHPWLGHYQLARVAVWSSLFVRLAHLFRVLLALADRAPSRNPSQVVKTSRIARW